MNAKLSLISALIVLALTGCGTPPLRTVEVGKLRNEAVASYSYAGPPGFELRGQTEIVLLAPHGSMASESEAATIRTGTEAARTETAAEAGRVESRVEKSEQRVATEAARSESDHAVSSVQVKEEAARTTAATERSRTESSGAKAGQRVATEAARTESDHAVSSTREKTEAAKTTTAAEKARMQTAATRAGMSSTAQQSLVTSGSAAASFRTESSHARTVEQVVRANTSSTAAAARVETKSRVPVFTKRASHERVVAGETFEYVLELRNETGLPLATVEIKDVLDPKLKVDCEAIYTAPSVKFSAAQRDRELTIVLKRALPAGETLSVYVPAVVNTNASGK